MTRKERLELNRQELAELTKIAKVILIDGFNSLFDEGAVTSCNGVGDTGNWEWIYNAGTATSEARWTMGSRWAITG